MLHRPYLLRNDFQFPPGIMANGFENRLIMGTDPLGFIQFVGDNLPDQFVRNGWRTGSFLALMFRHREGFVLLIIIRLIESAAENRIQL